MCLVLGEKNIYSVNTREIYLTYQSGIDHCFLTLFEAVKSISAVVRLHHPRTVPTGQLPNLSPEYLRRTSGGLQSL